MASMVSSRRLFAAFFCLSFTLLPFPCSGLSSLPPASFSLGMEDGLANNSVFCMLQDRRGLVWLGTFGGLSRYDGASFVNYLPGPGRDDLDSSVIFALLEDSRGSIWVGTDGGGLSRYEPATDSFSTFRASGPGGLGSDRIMALEEDTRGGIWVAGGDGALRRMPPSGGGFQEVKPPGGSAVRALLCDSRGRIWAGTEGDGLSRYRVEAEGVWLEADPALGSFAGATIRSLFEDSRGRLWIGLGDGRVFINERDGFAPCPPSPGRALPREAVRALAEDGEGMIWVGYADSGIGFLDPSTLRLVPPDSESPDSGGAAMVRSLIRDRRGLMWAGFKDEGFQVFNPLARRFRRFPALGGALGLARGLSEEPSGDILVGTDGEGLVRLKPAVGALERLPWLQSEGPESKIVSVLRGADGSLWLGTDGAGLLRMREDGGVERYSPARPDRPLPGAVVWALHESPSGAIWVGMEGRGLAKIDPGSGAVTEIARGGTGEADILGHSVRAILEDSKGRLWVGTWDGGLSRLDPGYRSFIRFSPSDEDPDSLPDSSVLCLFEDSSGTVWIGTGGGGLVRFDEAAAGFERFGEAEGLPAGAINGILEDGDGALWIAGSSGLFRRSRSGGFFGYGVEDGLAASETAQNSFLLAEDGRIWLGGPGGISSFHPRELPRPGDPPQVFITGLELPRQGTASAKPAAAGHELVLDHRNAGLLFHIAVADYVAPKRNRYAMMLEGAGGSMKGGWTFLGSQNSGYLAPLSPGRYHLRVRGANGNGLWSEAAAGLPILVLPPFWATWWFRLAAISLVAVLAAGAVALRVRNLHRRAALLQEFSRRSEAAREEERSKAAREVHDEIGQHLAALNLAAHWLVTHPEAQPEARSRRLEEVLEGISEAMKAVKNVVTGLRPMALDNLPFSEAVRWYVGEFERRSSLGAKLEAEAELPRLEGQAATALFRVLQEMLTNVVRHAEAKAVTVSLRREGAWLVLGVEDDGRGIGGGKAEARDSFGIIGMRERLAAFGGRLEIESRSGGGTRATARIPL